MENNSKRWKELETGDREHSERKVRKGKMNKDDDNHSQPHP